MSKALLTSGAIVELSLANKMKILNHTMKVVYINKDKEADEEMARELTKKLYAKDERRVQKKILRGGYKSLSIPNKKN